MVPSLPGSGPKMNPRWAVDAVRGWLLSGEPPASGGGSTSAADSNPLTRRVVNETEVSEALASLGFVTVRNEQHSVHEQAAMFAGAEIVVGAHGANLANVAFCSPGATLVELVSPRWLNTTYWRLCAQLDRVRHRCVVGRGDAPADCASTTSMPTSTSTSGSCWAFCATSAWRNRRAFTPCSQRVYASFTPPSTPPRIPLLD